MFLNNWDRLKFIMLSSNNFQVSSSLGLHYKDSKWLHYINENVLSMGTVRIIPNKFRKLQVFYLVINPQNNY